MRLWEREMESMGAGDRGFRLIGRRPQHGTEDLAYGGFVIDDQDSFGGHCRSCR